MARSAKKARRLVVGDGTYLWSVSHRHHSGQGCSEILNLRRSGAHGRLLIVFQGGPGRLVPDGFLHSGAVGSDGLWLNLHEPGTVRRLLDLALAHGWTVDDPATVHLDGWELFDAATRGQGSQ